MRDIQPYTDAIVAFLVCGLIIVSQAINFWIVYVLLLKLWAIVFVASYTIGWIGITLELIHKLGTSTHANHE